ncbi:MAG: hypothetical protein IT385_10175 [Deltaproteobacteria bacterium]|nr:hypothetical protein [Deltaproteobacteria bacterium]
MTTSLSPSPARLAPLPSPAVVARVEASAAVATIDVVGARRWLALAIGSLIVAGGLALFLVIGRVPPLDRLFDDPLAFKRGLVVHVVLALVVWFFAFIGGLWRLLPAADGARWSARVGHAVSALGVVALVCAAAWPGSEPVLSNYVPMIDNPLFVGGVIAFGAGLVVSLLDARLAPSGELDRPGAPPLVPPAARPALRAAALAILVAALTFAASAWTTPDYLAAEPWFEQVVWGGGHVLQFASSAAMCAVWLMLLTSALGRSPLSRPVTGIVFGLFVLPLMVAPLMADTQAPGSRTFFTRLMELAIFPAVSLVLVACVVAVVRAARRDGRRVLHDRRVLGFGASAALTLLGFGLGASIDGSNTMVPAHYHASIGAVTAAFMTVAYDLFAPLGLGPPGPRTAWLARWQPLAFGFGQTVFAAGFAIAGAHGLARKTYGAEQSATDAGHTVGLVVMGVGGLVAVAAGLAFLAACVSAWRRRARAPHPRHSRRSPA